MITKMAPTKADLNIISINCNGYKANSLYTDKLTKSYDCIHLSETWLSQSEFHLLHQYKKDFHLILQPANRHEFGRPFGGTALFLRRKKFQKVDTIIMEDHLTAVKTSHNNHSLIVMGVYLQSTNNKSDYISTYTTQLATLTGIIDQFNHIADPIILGDFQCCPDKPTTTRTAQPNTLSKHLSQFITDNNLTPIDIVKGQGPLYTYHHLSLPNKSYIDHILIPSSLLNLVTDTRVIQPDSMNTGDHLPVSLTLTLTSNDGVEPDTTTDTIENDFIPNHMWQNKEFITLYRQRVSESIKTHHTKDTETILNELQTTLQNCAAECYTTYQNKFYNFPSKPWWNDDLRKARKNLQLMFNTWRDEGFPRLDSNVSYNRYRFARKIFRTLVKRAKYQATVDHYINVEKLKRIKPTSYWKEHLLLERTQTTAKEATKTMHTE